MANQHPTDNSPPARSRPTGTWWQKLRAHSVHLYTAAGIVFAFLAVAEICAPQPDPRWVFLWLTITALIDSTDGYLARRWQVKIHAPRISGRTLDDIIDYLTFTFIPLLLIWRMEWLLAPAELWVALAMMASLFGFANTGAKQEAESFFLGFPSYWNVAAFYIGLWFTYYGPYLPVAIMIVLTIMTVLPLRFVYPSLAPHPWRGPLLLAGVAWLALLLIMLPRYPALPQWIMWLSLVYPAAYIVLSAYLDLRTRARPPAPRPQAQM